MSESNSFSQEIQEQTCAECPLRLIAPEVWEQCTQPEIETPLELSDQLKKRAYELSPQYVPTPGDTSEPAQLDETMSDIHESILPLFDEQQYPGGDYFLVDKANPHDALEIRYTSDLYEPAEQVRESEFSDTAQHVLACLRQNQATGCMNQPKEEPFFGVAGGLRDIPAAINVLEMVARHGSNQEVQDLLSRLHEQAIGMAGHHAGKLAAELKDKGFAISDDPTADNLRDALRMYAEALAEYVKQRDAGQ